MLPYLLFFLFSTASLSALTTLHVFVSTDNNPGSTGDTGDLRFCLNSMNESLNTTPDDYEIVFDFPMTIQLNGILPIINNSSNPVNITIGNSDPSSVVVIDGNNGAYSGFFIPTGNVTIQNMNFQNLSAKGGNGGDGISGGGGGMGAGGAIYAPTFFLNGANPAITLLNVTMNTCSAIGGNGGNYLGSSSSGNEGGGGGGGFSGNGGSITTVLAGSTGGGGGGGFGGDGGNVTTSTDDLTGGGGGGGGGIGSRATLGTPINLGNGGADNGNGSDGNASGISIAAGSGAGGFIGGNLLGGGGGGSDSGSSTEGGGGGGSQGTNGVNAYGAIPPGGGIIPSGGNGGDGGGGGGGGVVIAGSLNFTDGKAGSGGYGGGGGGGAGIGASDADYTVVGGSGGVGGGGGGGGVNQQNTPSEGGDSLGGGGGGGGGPADGLSASGGMDLGSLGGGNGGVGSNQYGFGFGGGGGGGGSGLGGAIFIDSNLNFTIQAIPGIPTVFNTINTTTQAGIYGSAGSGGGSDGTDGSALGNSIFLRTGSSLTFIAENTDDLLTLGEGVSFVDDTTFSGGNTTILCKGDGTIIYNGAADYQGTFYITNVTFQLNGSIDNASIFVCRRDMDSPRGQLKGRGSLTGSVFVNSGTISPDIGETLSLGSLTLLSGTEFSLGSLVHIEINSSGNSLVSVSQTASLAGILEINIDPNTPLETYTILTSSGITGTFDFVTFTGPTPNYTLSYLPAGNPTFVQFEFLGYPPSILPPTNLQGHQKKNNFGFVREIYNQLKWSPSVSSDVKGYFIYRDGQKIATVNSTTFMYQDHKRKKGASYLYTLTAFNEEGTESSAIDILVKP